MRVISIFYTLFSVAAFGSIIIFVSDRTYLGTKEQHVLKIMERMNRKYSDEPRGGVISTTNNIPGDMIVPWEDEADKIAQSGLRMYCPELVYPTTWGPSDYYEVPKHGWLSWGRMIHLSESQLVKLQAIIENMVQDPNRVLTV